MLQKHRVGARTNDLACGREIRRKIPDDGRIGENRALFMWDVVAVGVAGEPLLVSEQPDIDAEFVQHAETALGRSGRDQMLLDEVQFRIYDRASIECAER